MAACGISIGHNECNYAFTVIERQGHKASPEAWKNSKNKVYKRKIANQSKQGFLVKWFNTTVCKTVIAPVRIWQEPPIYNRSMWVTLNLSEVVIPG